MNDSPQLMSSLPSPAPLAPGTAERLARIVDTLPEGVMCLDRTWRITYANAEAIRISHLDPALFASKTHWELFPDLVGTELETRYRGVMDTRQADRCDFYYPPFDLRIDLHILPTDEGIALHYRDCSAQRRAETRELAADRERRQILETIPDAIVIVDRDWRFTFANQRALQLVNETDVLGHNIFELFPGNLEEPFHSCYRKTMAERVPTEFEAYYGGALDLWLKVQARPHEDGIVVFFSNITERKHSELREQQTAQRLAQVMDVTSDAIFTLDREWRITYMNPNATERLAIEKGLLGRTLWEAFPHVANSPVGEMYHRSMHLGLPEQKVMYYPEPLNAWFDIQSEPAPDGIVVFFRDITERKRSEAALRASEERYRVLADLNPMAIWMGNAAGQITYANQGFLAYLGVTVEDLSGMGWLDGFAPEDRDRVVAAWTRSVTTGVDYETEARLRSAASGELRWWHLKAAPVRDTSGTILHWLGVASDIDDAKTSAETLRAQQAEAERRRSELETVYRTSPVGLALLDPVHFTFLNLNDLKADMLGLPKDRILGRQLSEIAPPDKVSDILELLRKVAAGGHVRDHLLEGELAAPPGDLRAWNVNYSPVFNEDGSIRAISSAAIEVTNQKKAEAALIQSEKLAAVGRLASSISHEINNPLEAITNLLYLLALDPQLPDALKLYVHMAQSELSRVSQIATQTLRFHRQAVAATLVTPRDLVGAVVQLYAGRLANSGIRVEEHYRTETQILCFENDIRQVLNNLIANAIDAMRTGGRLLIRAHASRDYGVPEGRTGVRITIADTGHGMSHATLVRVFEPFFTTKDLQGTGLGLWISKGIVERHQGRLIVRSSEEERRHGTLFTLFLPCRESPPAAS